MKKGLLILFCAALVTSAQAQWSKTIDTPTKASYATTSSAVTVTPSGETYVAGSLTKEDVSFGNTALNFENTGDSFLFKYSATGEPVWANVINGESTQINAITYDNDGNIYVAGTYTGETTIFNGQDNSKQTATCNTYESPLGEGTLYTNSGFIAKYSNAGVLLKLETFKTNLADLPGSSFMFLIVDASFNIQDLQFINGKLYASVLYAGKTEKDGFTFNAKAFDDGTGMAADLYSGCVISLTTDLAIDAKLADLSPIVERANALYSVTDAKMYANTDHIYAIFGAMGNQTLTVGNSSENIELPIEGELYSRGIILADINIDGTLNQKNVYESAKVLTNDLQNVIGGISERDGKIVVAGLFNENLPFQNDLICKGKFDSYVVKINPSDLSVETARQGNIETPAIDASQNEYMTIYPTGTTFSTNNIYSTVDYGFSSRDQANKVVTTYSSYSIVYDYKSGETTSTKEAENVYKNGVGACDNKVSTVTINITNSEFDEGTFTVNQIIDGESSAIDNNVADKTTVKAYPNPVKDILNFSEVCDVTIVNGQGSVVKAVSATTQISVDDLAAGYYIAKIKTADGTTVIPFIKK